MKTHISKWVLALTVTWILSAEEIEAQTDIRRDAVVEAVAKVRSSVVNISTTQLIEIQDPFEQMWREFFGYRGGTVIERGPLGSGVIVDEEGYILTNFHVTQRAHQIQVAIGDKYYEARVEAASPTSDVALLKIESKNNEKFQAVKFAKDDDLLIGETVIAMGNPFGFGLSVSKGILSSTARRPNPERGELEPEDWLQTDAAVNPGNSGGPLINLHGELIGLNNAVYRANMAQGISFAIPIKRVGEALSEMFTPENKGYWFGAKIRSTSSTLKVDSVQAGSPAEKAGIRANDVVVKVGDKAPRNFIQFMVEMIKRSQQRGVPLTISRAGQEKTVNVQIVPEDAVFNAELIRQKIGITVQALTPELSQMLEVNFGGGLLVAGVDKNGPAAAAGLEAGFVLTAIDGEPVNDIKTAAKRLYNARTGQKLPFIVQMIQRQGNHFVRQQGRVDLNVR